MKVIIMTCRGDQGPRLPRRNVNAGQAIVNADEAWIFDLASPESRGTISTLARYWS